MSAERGTQKARPQMSRTVREHMEERGGLLGFATTRQERLALMKAALRQGLMVWNITRGSMNGQRSGANALRSTATRSPLGFDVIQEGEQPSRVFAIRE